MTKSTWITASAALVLSVVSGARAVVYLEHDFRTSESGGQVTASASNATTQFTMLNNVVLTEDASGPLAREEKIMTGVLTVPRASNADTSGIRSVATSGTNHRYEAFVGAGNTYASSTMVLVYRPNFTGASTSTRFLFDTGVQGNSNSVVWFISDTGGFVRLQLNGNAGGLRVDLPYTAWDASKWYMLVGTWTPGDKVRMYIRPIEDGGVTASGVSTNNVPAVGGNMVLPVLIGQGSDNSGNPAGSAAGGDFAYFLWNSDYAGSLAAFNNLYNTLIPEPGTAAVLIGASMFLIRGRRGLVA